MITTIITVFIFSWYLDLKEKVQRFVKTVDHTEDWIPKVEDDYLDFLSFTFFDGYYENFRIEWLGELNDDPDVMGSLYRVSFSYRLFGKDIEVPVADYYFYYDKSYKNRKEILCQHNDQLDLEKSRGLNALEKLVRGSIKALIKRELKKRLLA